MPSSKYEPGTPISFDVISDYIVTENRDGSTTYESDGGWESQEYKREAELQQQMERLRREKKK